MLADHAAMQQQIRPRAFSCSFELAADGHLQTGVLLLRGVDVTDNLASSNEAKPNTGAIAASELSLV